MDDNILMMCMFSFAAGWVVKTVYQTYKDELSINRILEEIAKEEVADNEYAQRIETAMKAFPLCYIEQAENTYWLYNTDTNAYMCQGDTYNELAEKVYNELKIELCLAKADDKAMWFIDGRTKDLPEV